VFLSVSRLARLLETGQYKLCLEEANRLLAGGEYDPEETARILAAVCRSCLELTDFHAAVQAGEQAAEVAGAAGAADVLGFVLVDLGTALTKTRRYAEAAAVLGRYLAVLPACTAARCMEGIALQRLADAFRAAERPHKALEQYAAARRWFGRFGDEASARGCLRAMTHLHLELGESEQALSLLLEGGRRLTPRPAGDGEFCERLLDWAAYYLATGQHDASAQAGFTALEAVGDNLDRQCRAQLLLCRNALAQAKDAEALGLAIAARVSAIDGRLYTLEFEATDVIFRLLAKGGGTLLQEVEADFARQGVTIQHYLSEQVLRDRLS
jgi:tetratricopeptide (TPR) repeat protein